MGKSILFMTMIMLWRETPSVFAEDGRLVHDAYVRQADNALLRIHQVNLSFKKCWWGRWVRWKCRRTVFW